MQNIRPPASATAWLYFCPICHSELSFGSFAILWKMSSCAEGALSYFFIGLCALTSDSLP